MRSFHVHLVKRSGPRTGTINRNYGVDGGVGSGQESDNLLILGVMWQKGLTICLQNESAWRNLWLKLSEPTTAVKVSYEMANEAL